MTIAKEGSPSKFDGTVEVAMRLGVDPRKADQMVRGTVSLPHGTGKTVRVIVFATGDKAEEARAAGADKVGSDDLIQEITDGYLDFDAAIATPDQMAKVGRIARVLGPRGLMPNPKTGTVTPDVAKAVSDIKGGKISFRVDKQSNLHLIIGKASFSAQQLVENYAAALDEIMRAKPSAAKGRYLRKVTFATTMGPGIPVDPNRTRGLLEDAHCVVTRHANGPATSHPESPGRSLSAGSAADTARTGRPRARRTPRRCRRVGVGATAERERDAGGSGARRRSSRCPGTAAIATPARAAGTAAGSRRAAAPRARPPAAA